MLLRIFLHLHPRRWWDFWERAGSTANFVPNFGGIVALLKKRAIFNWSEVRTMWDGLSEVKSCSHVKACVACSRLWKAFSTSHWRQWCGSRCCSPSEGRGGLMKPLGYFFFKKLNIHTNGYLMIYRRNAFNGRSSPLMWLFSHMTIRWLSFSDSGTRNRAFFVGTSYSVMAWELLILKEETSSPIRFLEHRQIYWTVVSCKTPWNRPWSTHHTRFIE